MVQLRGMLSGDDASKEQIERQVLNIWDKMYKTWFAKVVVSLFLCLQADEQSSHVCIGTALCGSWFDVNNNNNMICIAP